MRERKRLDDDAERLPACLVTRAAQEWRQGPGGDEELGVGDPSKLARREWPCRSAAAPAAFIHAIAMDALFARDAVPNAWVLQHVTQGTKSQTVCKKPTLVLTRP